MSISRRHILQSLPLATAGAAFAGAAQAQGGKSPNDQIQAALVGFGIMGQGDARTAASVPGVKVTAVADVYQGRLTKAKEVYGAGTFVTRHYEEVLSRKDIDAVIIATPDHWHAKISIDAMNAGKDIYCQKPMVQLISEGKGVIGAQEKTGRICQVGSQRVSSVTYHKAREVIRSGAIGEVNSVEAWIDRNSALGAWQYVIPPDASPETVDWDRFLGRAPKRPFEPIRLFRWRNYQDYGTGVGGDLFVHLFTGIHFVMDSNGPTRVMATGGLRHWIDGRDVPDVMMGMYDYPKTQRNPGFNVSLRVNLAAGGYSSNGMASQTFRFVGTDGVLTIQGQSFTVGKKPRETEPGLGSVETLSQAMIDEYTKRYREKYPLKTPAPENLARMGEELYTAPPGYSEQYAHHENFFASIRARRPVIEDAVFGFRAAAAALLSNESYFGQKICNWDPETMTQKG